MSDFEVCPVGTLQRLAQVEAEVLSMRRCFEATERQRDQYKAERDSMREILDHIPQVETEPKETSDRLHAAEAELRRQYAEIQRLRDVVSKVNSRCDHLGIRLGEVIAERNALLSLIADDAFASSFQTMAQYRFALLKATKGGGNG